MFVLCDVQYKTGRRIENNIRTRQVMEDKIYILQNEIRELRKQLKDKETILSQFLAEQRKNDLETNKYSFGLSTEDVTRYSRQMLVSDIGVNGQRKLKNSKILVVGAGGLGCPAAVYLASAGIGEITIVDYDEVELSNLHRQILHTEDDINIAKVDSAYDKLHRINRSINLIPVKQQINSHTIKELLNKNKYDVVIDGSDNVATRYLLNDACVLNNLPLVSGSALQLEAQLTVYNNKGGPCYRCLFPVPPPPETVTSCGDGGVLGPVPGVIGVLQALETIKILVESPGVLSGRFLLFDGSNATFRNVKLRPRNPDCAVCGDNPSIRDLIDYEQFCGASAHDKVINIDILDSDSNVNMDTFSHKLDKMLIIDVRPAIQYEICRLPNTYNVPLADIEKSKGLERIRDLVKDRSADGDNEVYVLCRRGNDSQRAIRYLKEKLSDLPIKFINVRGGLHAYSKHIDPSFPDY